MVLYRIRRVAALAALGASAAAFGQANPGAVSAYPQRTVRILVPTAPGGGTDIQARLIAKNFQEALGQAFVIENRQGASGMIGAELARKPRRRVYATYDET